MLKDREKGPTPETPHMTGATKRTSIPPFPDWNHLLRGKQSYRKAGFQFPMPELKPFKQNWIFQKQMKLFKEVNDAVLSLQVHSL